MKQQSAVDIGNSSMNGSIATGSRAKQQPGGHNTGGGGGGGSAVGVAAAAPAGASAISGGSGAAQRSASPSSSRVSHHRGKGGKGASSATRSTGATAAAREDARKRVHEMRGELEGVIHVLDGGVNRTPLPLQSRHSLVGGIPHEMQGGGGGGALGASRADGGADLSGTANTMNNDLGSSFMHSSFMFNMSSRSSNARGSMASSSMYNQSRSVMESTDGGSGGKRGGGGDNAGSRSLESSIQSFSFAGDRQNSERSSSPMDSSSMRRRSVAGGTAPASQLPRLVQQNTLLAESTYAKPAPLSVNDKAAWRKATTTIVLTETPTIFLYSHHDEIVSNEYAEEVAAVTTRNRDYAVAEELYRTDEGTRFHSTGAITMRAPMKSVQTEVHPPTKKDSGALQVTPWMLKDAYAAALAAAEEAEEDGQEEAAQQQGGDGGAGAGGEAGAGGAGEGGAGGGGDGGDGGDVDEALRDSVELNGAGSFEENGQSSENGQSTMISDTATHTMTSEGHGGGGKGGGGGGSGGRGGSAGTGSGGGGGGGGPGGVDTNKQWMLAETLLSTLRVMERAVVQNTMEAAQLAYRGITVAPPRAPASAPVKGVRRAGLNSAATTPALLSPSAAPPPLPAAATVHNTPLPPVTGDGVAAAAGAADGPLTSPEVKGPSATAAAVESTQTAAAASLTSAGMLPLGPNSAPPVRLSEGVHLLWRFGSPQLTCNRGVACMTWNRRESDMLAVGYTACRPSALQGAAAAAAAAAGGLGAGGADEEAPVVVNKRAQGQETHGMVCCWSLKNPRAPELILYLRGTADVTALAFSYEHPSLLAVGSSIGEIVVYDIQHDVVFPSIAPALVGATGGQHTGAIWELRWVPKGKEHGEFLTSISADGRVVQWAVGKSIERVPPDLMHLQRQPGTQVEKAFVAGVAEAEAAAAAAAEAAGAGKGKKGGGALQPRPPAPKRGGSGGAGGGAAEEAILSRQCGGMCFDICPADTAVYIVGTEDGSVLQCSKSQTENYDFEYEPHTELVYRVRWSPYSAVYFLTSSADWTSRLYKVGTAKAQLRFHSARQDAVQDVAWSHTNALVFATATAQGNAEVWTVMDNMCPRATVQYHDHRRLSAVLFAEQETPVLVVGDEEGDVTVFRLDGDTYIRRDLTDDEQEEWLAEAVRKQLM